jgi:beta-lactamase superfamily II metal-dependent hydrolase
MIDYGSQPAGNQIEITLFGPGYGEAIAVHLGEGCWFLVDSCIDPETKSPASESYLEYIRVMPSQVRVIVASHWHDDHVRGISQLATKYPNAEFVLSAVFNNKEAAAFLSAYSGTSSLGLARGTRELFEVIQARNAVVPALHRTNILEASLNGQQVRVTALSPLPAAFTQSLANMAQYLPRTGQAINHAANLRPNFEAVALHIDVGDDALLLGADLEDHALFGWSAVVSDMWSGARKQATAYKAAHHGSISGDCSEVWTKLLKINPIVCLTPFTLGRLRLPSDADKERLKTNASEVYICSGKSRHPDMNSEQLKRLRDITKNLAVVDNGFGAVRLRKNIGSSSWNVELFGSARNL